MVFGHEDSGHDNGESRDGGLRVEEDVPNDGGEDNVDEYANRATTRALVHLATLVRCLKMHRPDIKHRVVAEKLRLYELWHTYRRGNEAELLRPYLSSACPFSKAIYLLPRVMYVGKLGIPVPNLPGPMSQDESSMIRSWSLITHIPPSQRLFYCLYFEACPFANETI